MSSLFWFVLTVVFGCDCILEFWVVRFGLWLLYTVVLGLGLVLLVLVVTVSLVFVVCALRFGVDWIWWILLGWDLLAGCWLFGPYVCWLCCLLGCLGWV